MGEINRFKATCGDSMKAMEAFSEKIVKIELRNKEVTERIDGTIGDNYKRVVACEVEIAHWKLDTKHNSSQRRELIDLV